VILAGCRLTVRIDLQDSLITCWSRRGGVAPDAVGSASTSPPGASMGASPPLARLRRCHPPSYIRRGDCCKRTGDARTPQATPCERICPATARVQHAAAPSRSAVPGPSCGPRDRDRAVADDVSPRDPRVLAHQVAAEAGQRRVLARGERVAPVPDQLDPDREVVAPLAPAPAACPGVVGRPAGRDELRDATGAVDEEVRRKLLPLDLPVGGVPGGVEPAEEERLDVRGAEAPRRAGDVVDDDELDCVPAAVALVRARQPPDLQTALEHVVG